MKAGRSAVSRCAGAPLTELKHSSLLEVLNLAVAVLANVDRFCRLALGPPHLRKPQRLELPTVRTGNPVAPLVALRKRLFDPASPRDFRRRDHEHFPA